MVHIYWNRPYASAIQQPSILPRFLLAGYIIFSLVACSQAASSMSNTPTPQPSITIPVQVQPTPTTLRKETLLYQADWSHGFAGWKATSGWSVAQGQLVVNSLSETSIIAPYQPTSPNYAIEVHAQLVRVIQPPANEFFIVATQKLQEDGYQVGFESLSTPPPSESPGPNFYSGFNVVAVNSPDPGTYTTGVNDFVPGFNWRTYRVEIQGNVVSFFMDGTPLGNATSIEGALSNGPISLVVRGFIMHIRSFRVTTL